MFVESLSHWAPTCFKCASTRPIRWGSSPSRTQISRSISTADDAVFIWTKVQLFHNCWQKSIFHIFRCFFCVCYLLNVIVVIIIVRVSNIYWSVFHSVVFIELGSHGLLDCCLALLFTVEKNVQLKCCLASWQLAKRNFVCVDFDVSIMTLCLLWFWTVWDYEWYSRKDAIIDQSMLRLHRRVRVMTKHQSNDCRQQSWPW